MTIPDAFPPAPPLIESETAAAAVRPAGDARVHQPPDAADLQRHVHSVQFYSSDDFLLEALGRFMGSAVGAGDAAIVIATPAHRQKLAKRLAERGLDLTRAVEQGRYIALDAAETLAQFTVDGWPDERRFVEVIGTTITRAQEAARREHGRAALFGEMVALLTAEGNVEAALRLEQLWNHLAQSHSFSLMCAYPLGMFYREDQTDAFLKICAEHSAVIPAESYTLASEDERLRAIAQWQHKAQVLETEIAQRTLAAEANSRLAAIVESSLDAIIGKDLNGVINSWNRGAELLFGYTAREAIGRPVTMLIPESRLDEEAAILARIRRGERVQHYETIRRRKDGTLVDVSLSISPVVNAEEQVVGASKIARDITRLKKVEEQLRQANNELEARVQERTSELQKQVKQTLEAEQGLRTLTGRLFQIQDEERRRIARELHDSLGQQLAALTMNFSTLDSAKPKSAPYVKALAESRELLSSLAKEVRTLSHLLHPPLLEEAGLQSAIQWYVDGFSRRSGIKVTLELDRSFQRLPNDSELTIFRVIQESLTNIHRHSGSPTACIGVKRCEKQLEIEIRDAGRGIPEDRYREVNSGASGVGLRGMRERARQLGGTLEVNSDASGTCVRMILPMTTVSSAASA